MADDDESKLMPLWPHPEFARLHATGIWTECRPRSIEVHEWIETWRTRLGQENTKIAVFPVKGSQSTTAHPDRLAHDLEEELGKME